MKKGNAGMKRKKCRFHAAGNCRNGKNCKFVHDPSGIDIGKALSNIQKQMVKTQRQVKNMGDARPE